MITDEQLDERADELTTLFDMAGYGTFTTNPLRIYWNLKREALGVDRESLRLLEDLPGYAVHGDRMTEIRSHITTLRKRLGLNT